MYIYICIYIYICVYMYIYKYTHRHTHTHTHAHTHTYTPGTAAEIGPHPRNICGEFGVLWALCTGDDFTTHYADFTTQYTDFWRRIRRAMGTRCR